MYTPAHNKSNDRDEAFELIEQNPFATLISIRDGDPVVSHLPLTPVRLANEDLGFALIGHCARANPHSRALTNGPVTVVFQGPHAYISPRWYEENDVPTWNYSAIHIVGQVTLIEDFDGIIDGLKSLSAHAEKQWPSGWEFFLPDDLKSPEVVTRAIVGFKIKATSMIFKKKLAQNRSAADREGVIRGLEARGDSLSAGVAEAMRKMLPTRP